MDKAIKNAFRIGIDLLPVGNHSAVGSVDVLSSIISQKTNLQGLTKLKVEAPTSSSCPSCAEYCDGHCDHYLADHDCGVWFCEFNATDDV